MENKWALGAMKCEEETMNYVDNSQMIHSDIQNGEMKNKAENVYV